MVGGKCFFLIWGNSEFSELLFPGTIDFEINMEKSATSKYVRISPFKARELTRLIQKKPVNEALAILDFSPRKAGRLVGKTLRSAIANVENNPDSHLTKEELIVKSAEVGEGPKMKRFRPKARGMAGRILHRTSHIKIVVAGAN